ncbi:LysR family transcriptional regulator [Alginatibacterium sediminis]|uniref:LysR family transcriptional regulator n=1 Tax=Alginatibacterium sediminis TaxID=2164068 RepID=A0A420EBL7_9ALTE|nr:LysR family transcriptional regulator [Alginatibacterium sediminis]RKF18078.1 LysR family transcriptional regulator [Alginatibacterium sediminis]
MNFSLEQLSAFVTVYEEKAFRKAAEKLNKHRTTIAQVITNLEDQLAVTLFERSARSVEPTTDAVLLYHYAKQALEQAKTFDKFALSLSFGGLESVTIAYSSLIPTVVVSKIRRQIDNDFPTMRVNLIIRSKQEIKKGIQDGNIQFGIVNIYESQVINSIDYTFLGNLPFVPYCHSDNKLAKMSSNRTLQAMSSVRQFVLKSMIDDGMAEKAVIAANHESVDQLSTIISLIQDNLGWALLPKAVVDSGYDTQELVEIQSDKLLQDFKVPFALWCPHSKQVSELKKTIVKVLDAYGKQLMNPNN